MSYFVRTVMRSIFVVGTLAWGCTVIGCGGSALGEHHSSDASKVTSQSSTSAPSIHDGEIGRLVVAVNAGGDALNIDSLVFQADRFFRGGTQSQTLDDVSGAKNSGLFQTERYGRYRYEIPVSQGAYQVRLHFAEIFHMQANARVFSVAVEGRAILNQLDLFQAHGHDTAYSVLSDGFDVADGSLTIELDSQLDHGTLSGFEIYSASGMLQEPDVPVVEARNPNLWADVPDMSVIRVGETYYMSSTTMHMSPGVPIMTSSDLVNWELVSYAHQALDENNNALNMNGANAYGKGTWASSINYKDGVFYVTSFSYTTGKTYIWTSSNPREGQWRQITLNNLYHDASLIFDDNRAYLAYGHDDIRLVELTSDLSRVRAGGVDQQIISKASSVAGSDFILTAEGTQIQKINGWYYVSNICWPRGASRTQIVHRSRNITGPYEGRLVLQDKGVAQGQYISTPSGDWYLYAFRDSGAVGRIPYLVPITWQDDWPVVANGRVPDSLGFDVEDLGLSGLIRSDEFSEDELDLVWQWNHNPEVAGWSLNDRSGYLRLLNTRVDDSFVSTRNTLTQRMFGPTSRGIVALELEGMKEGDVAGFGALQYDYGYIAAVKNKTGTDVVMVISSGGLQREVERISLNQPRVYFRIDGDFEGQTDQAHFFYSLDGERWQPLGDTLRMTYDLKHFMGYRFSLFNYATRTIGGYVDFDYFRVSK